MALAIRLFIIDTNVIDFVQWRIADPLQFRGFSLLTQSRCISALIAVIQVHDITTSGRWSLTAQFLLFAFWLARAVWPNEFIVRRLTPDMDPINILRFLPLAIIFRLVVLFNTIISLGVILEWWRGPAMMGALTLLAYLEACTPKPRRPKRRKVRHLVPVEV